MSTFNPSHLAEIVRRRQEAQRKAQQEYDRLPSRLVYTTRTPQ